MRADDLSREQCRELFDRVQPMLLYLAKLDNRMGQCRFPPDDPLWKLVANARAAVYDLRQELHHRSASGVMRGNAE